MTAIVASAPSPLWYVTRGSGIVTLILLTASICLGVASAVGWHRRSLPRFVVAGLHRNLTLLAVVFLALHVATTVADSFTPIGVRDGFVPFVASYRPLWLGLGAIACDLLLALVVTSLVRVRIGYRVWRATHWLAYAAWPLALVHALGTGSDARSGWMAAIALACVLTVVGAISVRATRGGFGPRSIVSVSAAAACAFVTGLWYWTGPARQGWAARAGTPSRLLASSTATSVSRLAATRPLDPPAPLPRSFAATLSGSLTRSLPDSSGLVTVQIAARVKGQVRGELRFALRGAPDSDGGISMASNGVAFEGSGPTPVYEGSVVALDGPDLVADLSDPAGATLHLLIVLRIDRRTGTVSGSLDGAQT